MHIHSIQENIVFKYFHSANHSGKSFIPRWFFTMISSYGHKLTLETWVEKDMLTPKRAS